MNGADRAERLVAELDRILEEVRRQPTVPAAETTCPCELYRAACEAAEAVRILETHHRKAGLSPEGLQSLERYGRIYERAELMMLELFPHA